MPIVTLDNLLSSPVITKVISQIKTPLSRFQDFYGMGIGGRFTNPVGGRTFGWDIFDNVRDIATGRPFGTGPANVAPRRVDHVPASPYRAHEQVALLEDRLYRTRPLGGGVAEIDVRGSRYVNEQAAKLAQRFKNNREFMVSRMFRGRFGLKFLGEDWVPVDSAIAPTGAHIEIDYRVPALNKGNVNGIFAANWENAAALIHEDLLQLNAYSEEITGWPVTNAWITGTLWNKILANTEVKALAGTSNTPFASYERVNTDRTDFQAQLRGIPWITWHIYDGGLNVNGTFTKFIENNAAIFTPEPSSDWCEMLEGSEIVKENVMDGGSERYGFTAWTTDAIDPASKQLKALDICLPALYVPRAIFYATVATGL